MMQKRGIVDVIQTPDIDALVFGGSLIFHRPR